MKWCTSNSPKDKNGYEWACSLSIGHEGPHVGYTGGKIPWNYPGDWTDEGVIPKPADTTPDLVDRPSHYTSHPSAVECIEITEWLGFNLGNAFKYLFRRNTKGDLKTNLEKALWYLNREQRREGVWIEGVPDGTIDALRDRVNRVAQWEPTNMGRALETVVLAATGDSGHIADAIAYVGQEIERVCK